MEYCDYIIVFREILALAFRLGGGHITNHIMSYFFYFISFSL